MDAEAASGEARDRSAGLRAGAPGAAVITGASGGIGASCAELLAARGHPVVAVGRRAEPLEELAARLREAGSPAIPVRADVRDEEAMQRIAELAVRSFGSVSVLVNSAGGQFASEASRLSLGGWRAVIESNLTGTFLASKAVEPLMRERGGAIVNVVANIWQRAAPLMAHSGAARAGVVSLTRTLALEWAERGIRVNAVSPGVTDTPGIRAHVTDLGELASTVPVGRLAQPREIAELVAFLAGENGAYITGEVIAIDGGLQLA